MKITKKSLLVLLFAGVCHASPAYSEDVSPAVQTFLDTIERQVAVKPTYETLNDDGNGNVTISKMILSRPAEGVNPAIAIRVDEVALSGIADRGNGLYEFATATFSGINGDVSAEGMSVTYELPKLTAEGWYVKAAGENPTPEDLVRSSMYIARKMSFDKFSVTVAGHTFSTNGYESTWDGDPVTGAGTFAMKMTNIAVPGSVMAAADPTGMMKQLGYSSLAFDFSGDGKMDIDNGNMGFDFNFAYAGRDMGTLKIGMGASEVPLAVYAELQKANMAGKEPDFNTLMPQLQNITINGFSMRFEDQSITKKLMPMMAQMMGLPDEAALVANAGAMMQVSLMQLNNPAFTEQVVNAVNAYLKDPKSITFSMKPATPVKVMDFMAMNPANPGEAITKLGISVTAND